MLHAAAEADTELANLLQADDGTLEEKGSELYKKIKQLKRKIKAQLASPNNQSGSVIGYGPGTGVQGVSQSSKRVSNSPSKSQYHQTFTTPDLEVQHAGSLLSTLSQAASARRLAMSNTSSGHPTHDDTSGADDAPEQQQQLPSRPAKRSRRGSTSSLSSINEVVIDGPDPSQEG